MFGGVADDRDDHGCDEELARAHRLRECVERMDEDLAHDSSECRRDRKRRERSRQRPRAGRGRATLGQ